MSEKSTQATLDSLVNQLFARFPDRAWLEHALRCTDAEAFIKHAGDRYIATLLPRRLAQQNLQDSVPVELWSVLELIQQKNRARNEELLAEFHGLERIAQELGLPLLPLKGMASIASGAYADIGDRMLGDIDVLLPDATAACELMRALRDREYLQLVEKRRMDHSGPPVQAIDLDDSRIQYPEAHHHLPPVTRHGLNTTIELHHRPTSRRDPAARWLNELAGLAFSAEPSHQSDAITTLHVVHCLHHSLIADGGYARDTVDWRRVNDVARIMDLEGDAALSAAIEFKERVKHHEQRRSTAAFLASAANVMQKDPGALLRHANTSAPTPRSTRLSRARVTAAWRVWQLRRLCSRDWLRHVWGKQSVFGYVKAATRLITSELFAALRK